MRRYTSYRIFSLPTIAVDPVDGYIYIAYLEYDGGDTDVRYVRSTNGGTSWSSPQNATDAGSALECLPWLTVDSTGIVSLVYCANKNDEDSVDVYVAYSTNNGAYFTNPNIRVSERSSVPKLTASSDYIGICSKTGFAYPCWTDARNRSTSWKDIYWAIVDYPPSKPTGVAVGPGGSFAAIIWDANPEDDIAHYEVWRHTNDWTLIDSTSNTYYLDYGFDPDPEGLSTAKYKIRAKDDAGQLSSFSSETDTIRGDELQEKISSRGIVPIETSLSQNYPNPFNPETEIEFTLPEASNVKLTVYNILGQIVEVLVNSEMQAGYHAVQWSGKDVSSGVYFCQLTTDKFTDTKRMILMK